MKEARLCNSPTPSPRQMIYILNVLLRLFLEYYGFSSTRSWTYYLNYFMCWWLFCVSNFSSTLSSFFHFFHSISFAVFMCTTYNVNLYYLAFIPNRSSIMFWALAWQKGRYKIINLEPKHNTSRCAHLFS